MDHGTLEKLYTTYRYKWLMDGVGWEGQAKLPVSEDVLHDVCVEILEGSQADPFEDELHHMERLLMRRIREGRQREQEQAEIPRTPSEEQLRERELIQEAMEGLTPKQAGSLWRCLAGGETLRALAEEEGISFRTVQERVETGSRRLRECLGGLGEGRKQRGERRVRRDR